MKKVITWYACSVPIGACIGACIGGVYGHRDIGYPPLGLMIGVSGGTIYGATWPVSLPYLCRLYYIEIKETNEKKRRYDEERRRFEAKMNADGYQYDECVHEWWSCMEDAGIPLRYPKEGESMNGRNFRVEYGNGLSKRLKPYP